MPRRPTDLSTTPDSSSSEIPEQAWGSAIPPQLELQEPGDLRGDPELGSSAPIQLGARAIARPSRDLEDREIWFDPDELAAASRVELGDLRGDLEPGPGIELARDQGSVRARVPSRDPLRPGPERGELEALHPGLELGRLPGWPGAGPSGAGLGAGLGALIGDLRPGDLAVFSACEGGVGRSAILAQLGDGLALSDHDGELVTPVLVIGDGVGSRWRARTLGRWAGRDPRAAAGRQTPDRPEDGGPLFTDYDRLWAPTLARRQRFLDRRALFEGPAGTRLSPALSVGLGERLRASAADPNTAGDRVVGVWPVLVLDDLDPPLESDPARTLERLAALAELARREGLIVLVSVDAPEQGFSVAGLRAIRRLTAAHLCLAVSDPDTNAGAWRSVEVSVVHTQLGPSGAARLRWRPASGRLEPDPEPEAESGQARKSRRY